MKQLVAAAAMTLAFTACASTKKIVEKEPADPSGYEVSRAQAIEDMERNFLRVNFEFDSAQITGETQAALAANVDIMRSFHDLGVEVEGHCDEVGSTEYNLALGQRRADAIRKYMVTAGIAGFRIRTISYGEEKPVSFDGDEDAMSVNRRAEFRVTIDPSHEVRGTVADHDDDELAGPVALVFE